MNHKAHYWHINGLLQMIEEPNRSKCRKLYQDNGALFRLAPGSAHNHQAWTGGYHDHVTEVMNIVVVLFEALGTQRPLPFTLSDAVLVMFLHDIEKAWKYAGTPGLDSKEDRQIFQLAKLVEYDIELSPEQANALKYVEGEFGSYKNDERTMHPLAAFCHMCDVASARLWFDHPLETNDPWTGATRCAKTPA